MTISTPVRRWRVCTIWCAKLTRFQPSGLSKLASLLASSKRWREYWESCRTSQRAFCTPVRPIPLAPKRLSVWWRSVSTRKPKRTTPVRTKFEPACWSRAWCWKIRRQGLSGVANNYPDKVNGRDHLQSQLSRIVYVVSKVVPPPSYGGGEPYGLYRVFSSRSIWLGC